MTTALAALGRDDDARVLVPHIDDVGGSHGSIHSMLHLTRAGFVTCGSVMVPSGWFAGTAAVAVDHPELDLGVHLTLTSESAAYRWRPISTTSRASGLIDVDGYLWRDVASVRRYAHPDAVEGELRAQIAAARSAGIDVTHLDHHMGAAVAPEFVAITAALAAEHELPIMLPAELATFYDVMDQPPATIAAADAVRDALAAQGRIVVDRFLMGLSFQDEDADAVLRRFVAAARPGVTFLSFHAASDTDIRPIHPNDAAWRIAEDAVMRDVDFLAWVESQDVALIGFREIRDRQRTPFVPPDFDPPDSLIGEGFRLEPLGPEHNDRDHAAWMSSIDHIRATPGFRADGEWPTPMTLERNEADLRRHAADFASRRGFTYSVLLGEDVVGCVYIYPSGSHDASVRSWVTAAHAELDEPVWRAVSAWLAADWPFGTVAYAPRG